jgi:electron transport complex protein RnfB
MIEFIIQNPFFAAVIALLTLGVLFGAILGFGAVKFAVDGDPIVDQINAILPQTQCGQCGYPGCKPYAEAIANGDAINKCPPGGEAGIIELANLLDVEPMALDDEHGVEDVKKVAFIREDECIGCTKCIQACPIDAILGAAKQMHTVIAKECTGCDLCVEPCPVDCIDMIPAVEGTGAWKWDIPDRNPAYNANIIVTDRSQNDSGRAA